MTARRLEGPELAAYDHVSLSVSARTRVHKVRWLPDRAGGLTLGRHILLVDDGDTIGTSKLLAHELVHVEQYHQRGVARFLTHYLKQYRSGRHKLRDHHRAYLAIDLEVEARRRAAAWAEARRPPTM